MLQLIARSSETASNAWIFGKKNWLWAAPSLLYRCGCGAIFAWLWN
ncbi:hypothetical protein QUB56_30915 [Microcoleus sp. AR_TQ3_B6]